MRLVLSFAFCLAVFVLTAPMASPQKKDQYSEHIAPTGPRSPEEEKKLFRLPPGYEMQLVAAEPDIKKPININFDAKGRLWVTHSVEYPFPAKPGQKTRDSVKILEDFGPDGKVRKVSTFADNLNIPIGVLPLNDGAMVYTIPNIMRLRDTTGVGKADKRDVLYTGYGYADTHGMTGEFVWGFDGWVYACHGFSNTSKVKSTGQEAITMQSGNTYRIKPDGSRIEYFTHGQVNPFGLTFDPLGNIYSCDCHSQPVYQLLKGAYYPSFGKPDDGLGFAPEMLTKYKGSTAIGGITYYAADYYPASERDTIFFGDVVTNQIMQVRYKLNGSSPKALTPTEFVGCSDRWFRPVDIKLGPDGALYVADFYTPIIGHYEVPLDHPKRDNQHGRIWRIIYKGKDGKNTLPALRDFTKEKASDLVQDLGNSNLTVRLTAANQLVERGGQEIIEATLKAIKGPDAFQRVHGLWVLARLNALDDGPLIDACFHSDPLVRVHAMRVMAERKELSGVLREQTIKALKDKEPLVRRTAAEALGAHPHAANIRPLVDGLAPTVVADSHLVHVFRMALRDQLRKDEMFAAVTKLDLKDSDRSRIAEVCLGLDNGASARYLLDYLTTVAERQEKLPPYMQHIARFGPPGTQSQLAELTQKKFDGDWNLQSAVLRSLAAAVASRGEKLSDDVQAWGEKVVTRLLQTKNQKQVIQGIDLGGTLKTPALQPPLERLLLDPKSPEALRKPAIAALASIDPKGGVPTFGKILGDSTNPQALREQAAATLGAINRAEAHEELLKGLATAPAKLEVTFAMNLAKTPQGSEKLLQAVAAGKASPRLLQEQAVLVNLKQAKVKDLDQRLKVLTKGLPPADVALQKLLDQRRVVFTKAQADPAQGLQLFEKHCASCHQIAGKGAKIGPNLDGLGLRGVDRIIEDILDPNRNVDQAFRSTFLVLKNGQIVQGLLLREEGAVLVMADAQGKEVRVAKDQVDEQRVSGLSPMPANFAEQIAEPEFAHLLAYLLAQRPASKE